MSVRSYQETQNAVETRRASEYRQLGVLTAALIHARDHDEDAKGWANAVFQNQQFWSHLRVNMLGAHTSLPAELRLRMISLSEWVEKESIMAASGSQDVESLIAVNQQIMEGLKPYVGSLQDDTLKSA
jgi:flagellar biosynthesis regulator FlaF